MTAVLVVLTAAASGEHTSPQGVGADVTKPGVVTLVYFGRPGSRVYFDERAGGAVKRIGSLPIGPGIHVVFPEATVWRCDRLRRHFEATEVRSDGTHARGSLDVRTGTCAQRFKLRSPSRLGRGALARVRVFDRWNLGGIGTRLCITPPRGRPACRSLAFRRAVNVRSRRFRATKRGRWKIELRVGGSRERTAVAVGSGGRRGQARAGRPGDRRLDDAGDRQLSGRPARRTDEGAQ